MSELVVSNEIFHRCSMPIIYELDSDPKTSAPLPTIPTSDYSSVTHAAYNLSWNLPKDHTNVRLYERCIGIPPVTPYYQEPTVNALFPRQFAHSTVRQPEGASLLPLLIAARCGGVSIDHYDVVSERNSFRKIAMNNEDYVISVQKRGKTLFLRRHDRRIMNTRAMGHRFEEMCRPGYQLKATYHRLIEGRIGGLRTLITAETDAISMTNGDALELKCRSEESMHIQIRRDYWLQGYLGAVTNIIFGCGSTGREPQLQGSVHTLPIAALIDDREKRDILQRLHQVLAFLQSYVKENEVYLFSRRIDQQMGQHGTYLYRVLNHQDRNEMTFITERMLKQLADGNRKEQQLTTAHLATRKFRSGPNSDSDDDDAFDELYSEDDMGDWLSSEHSRLSKRKKENIATRQRRRE